MQFDKIRLIDHRITWVILKMHILWPQTSPDESLFLSMPQEPHFKQIFFPPQVLMCIEIIKHHGQLVDA